LTFRSSAARADSVDVRTFLDGLNVPTRIGTVIAGYALAIVAAFAAGWLYDLRVSQLPYDTSGGMYAGGEMITALGVFLVAAVVPTLLGLWFVRRNETFWRATGVAAIVFGATGLLAVLGSRLADVPGRGALATFVELFALAQLLGVPIWTVSFALFARMAPSRPTRRLMLIAVALELAVGVCAAIHWFVPRPPV